MTVAVAVETPPHFLRLPGVPFCARRTFRLLPSDGHNPQDGSLKPALARRPSRMDQQQTPPPALSHPLRWFPEPLELSHRRLRPQARMLSLSLVVGVVAGIGAVAFY